MPRLVDSLNDHEAAAIGARMGARRYRTAKGERSSRHSTTFELEAQLRADQESGTCNSGAPCYNHVAKLLGPFHDRIRHSQRRRATWRLDRHGVHHCALYRRWDLDGMRNSGLPLTRWIVGASPPDPI